MSIEVGKPAPDFILPDQDGNEHTLSQYRGKQVLLYFYPKDDTPGCTKEACAVRDSFQRFLNADAVVLGVSADSVESHKKFAEKYSLPFPLLSDEKKMVVNAYGVWGKKQFMGKTFDGIHRRSFLIDVEGRIAKIYDKVSPADHADEVLEDLKVHAGR